MNRISRRSAADAAEALLEVGRSQPALNYDVELGLERHQQWVRNEAPMPEWASAGVGLAAKSWGPIAIKTIVSAVLTGMLAVAGWRALGHPQPSVADAKRSSAASEATQAAAPSAEDVTASEAWMARTPMPVSDHGLAVDQPARRSVRADVPDKRTTRWQRAHNEAAPARAGNARAEQVVPRAETADALAARAEPATARSSEAMPLERAAGREVAVAPEQKPIGAAHRARPEPGPQAQVPDDLVEMRQVASAEQLLERSPERALALVRQGDQRFARGYFQQERAYIAIMALIRLGRIGEARARAASFTKQFPALPYGARIRSALEAREGTAPGAASRGVAP